MTVQTEIRKARWTGERIARLGFLLGLGWDARRIAAAAIALRLPPEAASLYDAAAAKRSLTRESMIRLLLLVVATDPALLDNILDDGA